MQGKQPRHCVFRPVASLLIALALAPAQAAPLRCTGIELVSLLTLEPRPLFELRYASPYNVLGTSLYPQLNPQLRCPVALALQQVQQAMWEAIRDPRYVSDPAVNAGRHTRGTAVDVTLVDLRGTPLPMPTDFDDFSEAAHVDAPGISPERSANAIRLREAMTRRGFQAFPTEWWHFDWKTWSERPVVGR